MPDQNLLEPSDVGGDHERYVSVPALLLKIPSWARQAMELVGNSPAPLFPPHASGSKSQNCLWNSLIDGLTGNVKEKPRPMIVHDPRPPEEILADELPQLDSPEALVKTSFRFGGLQLSLFLLICLWSYFSPVGCHVSVASKLPHFSARSKLELMK